MKYVCGKLDILLWMMVHYELRIEICWFLIWLTCNESFGFKFRFQSFHLCFCWSSLKYCSSLFCAREVGCLQSVRWWLIVITTRDMIWYVLYFNLRHLLLLVLSSRYYVARTWPIVSWARLVGGKFFARYWLFSQLDTFSQFNKTFIRKVIVDGQELELIY